MLNVCFTADHELFFGENYLTEDEILINPAYKLMDILKENCVPLTLFTDVCSILKYSELGLSDYAEKMEAQLVYAIRNGHDVQLHLHPHWISSEFDGKRWLADRNMYKLHDFGFNTGDGAAAGLNRPTANEIISRGKLYLERLLRTAEKHYECVAFRAGGWCIQPERQLLKALADEGIIIDSTIYKGGFLKTDTHYYDFRNIPDGINWWIDPELGIECRAEPLRGNIFEVSIGSYEKAPDVWGCKLKNKVVKELTRMNSQRPRGASICPDSHGILKKIWQKGLDFLYKPVMFSYDGSCKEEMLDVLRSYLRRYDCVNNNFYISIIGHPKCLFESNFREIGKFCKAVCREYSETVRFIRISDILPELFKSCDSDDMEDIGYAEGHC